MDFICRKIQQCAWGLTESAEGLWLCFIFLIHNQIKICVKILRQPVVSNYHEAHRKSMIKLANSIYSDSPHVLNSEYQLLPSNRRFRIPTIKHNGLKHSFMFHFMCFVMFGRMYLCVLYVLPVCCFL